jgi:hypothetical protein
MRLGWSAVWLAGIMLGLAKGSYGQPLFADELSSEGRVQSVDMSRRELVLKESDGNLLALQVSPDVDHLKFIQPGQFVQVQYVQPVALSLADPLKGAPAETPVEMESTQHKPGTVTVHTRIQSAIVDQIDHENRTLTLRSPEGNRIAVKVSPDVSEFNHLKTGDTVVAQFTEGLVFDLQKA